ncbi:sigma-70 family RNA polymerase sigma factor [Fontivita pretiosa]|uniref:sigma-70 family RNA polymerase sigma factor n=1 Tax=Fontivita pretiosa TaxID=2989684 RepID=UPI003D1859ED
MQLEQLDEQARGMWTCFHHDRTNLTALNALSLIYLPLARRAAHSEACGPTGRRHRIIEACDLDDLEQLGFLALRKLIASYRPDRNGGSFVKYASPIMRLRIKAEARVYAFLGRRGCAHVVKCSIDDEQEQDRIGALAADDEPGSLDMEDRDFLDWLCGRLGCKLGRVFVSRFLLGMNAAQIADEMGVSVSAVSIWIHRKILPMVHSLCREHAPADQRTRLHHLARARVPIKKNGAGNPQRAA